MFAIVDIETTGGFAGENGITEIAIILFDGRHIEGQYQTLINPGVPIPRYISSLTGISNEMVYSAPPFAEVASHVHSLLQGRIFVAHNVNFDYSFIRYHLQLHGFDLNAKRLCTVRMSKKVFPGYLKYSLGSICRELDITIVNRHRAFGDAAAAAELFGKILKADTCGHVKAMLKGKSKEQYLPPNVPVEHVERLPYFPGVYYFHDHKGKIIYVGKARNLQYRVKSHFSNNDKTRRKQDFLRDICSISHQVCGSELMALILECAEIRRLWPAHNRSLKRFEHTYGLYSFEDQKGYIRLVIEKKRKHLQPLYTFNYLQHGYTLLRKLVSKFMLDEGLCFVGKNSGAINEDPVSYNTRVQEAIQTLQKQLPTFAILGNGTCDKEQSCLLVEQGRFYGMGYLPVTYAISDINELKTNLTAYPDSDYVRGLVYQFAEKNPHQKITFSV